MLTDIFTNAVVAGIPLLIIVMGVVQFIKSFGLSGNTVKALSLGTGILIGLGYQVSLALPADFATWFAAGVFGLVLGLVASGVYDVITPSAK